MTVKQKPVPKAAVRIRLGAGLKIAEALQLPEESYGESVRRLEAEPLFQELLRAGVIKRRRFPGVSPAFFRTEPLGDRDLLAARGDFAAPDEDLAAAARAIGQSEFVRLFLFPEHFHTVEDLARQTGLTKEYVRRIGDMVNRLGSDGGAGRPAGPAGNRVVARVRASAGELVLEDLTFDLVRGRYLVDPAGLERLRSELPAGRKARINGLLNQLQWINGRRQAISLVLGFLVRRQRDYLCSGGRRPPEGLTQRAASRELGVHPSVINRAVARRALETPWGESIPLRGLFPGRRGRIQQAISRILQEQAGRKMSDRRLQWCLKQEFGITLARRTVNHYRRTLP